MTLSGKAAVITGASRGIGRAIAVELAKRGAKVMVNYAKDADGASATVEAVRSVGGEARAMQADVADMKAAEELIKAAVEVFGSLEILVNNAGTTRDGLIMLMPESDWDAVIQTNLKSTFNCSKAAVRTMMKKRAGRIINISSVSGIMGNAGQTNYSASKAGMIGFTKALAREVAARNITVNAVAPGFVPTALTNDLPAEIKDATLKTIPLNRWGTPEEIAYAVAFLASDEAAYITGQVLSVDGGLAMA
jgi:3-oxoacyl-[acyl-carrier protein] reductase